MYVYVFLLSLSSWLSHKNPKCIPLFPYAYCMPCPSHPPPSDSFNYIRRILQVVKILIVQFSPTSYLGTNVLLSTLFSNTFSLCSSLNVRHQVWKSYKTTGKVIVLCILMFTFVDSRQKDLFILRKFEIFGRSFFISQEESIFVSTYLLHKIRLH